VAVGHPDDRELVRRMRAGREEAFEEFFGRYFPGLYRFALARLGEEDAAEEAAQAALARALARLATYRGEAALFTWLCTFCRHEIFGLVEQRRRGGTAVALVEDAPEVRAALELLAGSSGPDEALGRRETARLVQATLDALPPRYGDALEWKYVEGLSVREIAERLALRPKAAESLLTRAREAFREGFSNVAVAARGVLSDSPPEEA
jgi:RNA polymerase sigma-70 factor (ECF subfamily)